MLNTYTCPSSFLFKPYDRQQVASSTLCSFTTFSLRMQRGRISFRHSEMTLHPLIQLLLKQVSIGCYRLFSCIICQFCSYQLLHCSTINLDKYSIFYNCINNIYLLTFKHLTYNQNPYLGTFLKHIYFFCLQRIANLHVCWTRFNF